VSALGRVALALPGLLTFGLGTWQVSRLQWKYEQIELRAALLARPPRLVSRAAHVGGDSARQFAPEEDGTEFERVRLVGRFDHAGEVCVGMRGKPGAKEEERGAGDTLAQFGAAARVFMYHGSVPRHA
jgi:cytochrome oxidase assembly protein ShyY1